MPCARARDGDARGFVLVGVTMFILVLTILGLSLFSLSGFEGQFMIRSMNHSQAFNAAAGGIDRARFALLATDQLMSVKSNLTDGVDYAVAVQNDDPVADENRDTVGTVQNNGNPVWVRVRARRGDATVMLQARFSTGSTEEHYRRLITARQVILPPDKSQIFLSGKVGQDGNYSMVWHASTPSDPPGRSLEVINNLQLAKLTSYLAQPCSTIVPSPPGTYVFPGSLNPLVPRYFRVDPQSVNFTVDDNNGTPIIKVRGTVVWLVPARAVGSIRFAHRVTVERLDPLIPSILVIAAGTISDTEEIQSVELDGGIVSGTPNIAYPFDVGLIPPAGNAGVPIIIATPGIVAIGAGPGNLPSFASYLSIYAGRVEVEGPTSGGATHLWNLPSMDPLVPDAVMDLLYDLGILPNANLGGTFLSFDSGYWSILSESAN